MLPLIERTDCHVHFFTSQDLLRVSAALPYALPAPHSLTVYLDNLIDAGIAPRLINNVHLSILPDSENVFASFDELKSLQPSALRRREVSGDDQGRPRLRHPATTIASTGNWRPHRFARCTAGNRFSSPLQ